MGSWFSSKKLKNSQILELTTKTSFSRKEILRWQELFFREYPSGQMDQESFIKENIYVHGGDRELWLYLFKVLDKDNSGKVDFLEFINALAVGIKGSVDDKLKWAFTIYDLDKNGSIEEKEMEKLLSGILRMGQGDTDETENDIAQRSKAIFDRMDVDGDGQLSMEEFVLGCKLDPNIISAMSVF